MQYVHIQTLYCLLMWYYLAIVKKEKTMSQIQYYLETKPYLIPAVVCFPIKGNEVLLMHRIKTSSGLGQDLVSGIGGKVGDLAEFANETHEEALLREVEEEVGIVPTNYRNMGRVRFLWAAKPKWNMDVQIFIVEAWTGEPINTDVAQPVWHKVKNLPKENMWEDNLHWVPKVLAGANIDAVFLYDELGKLADFEFVDNS